MLPLCETRVCSHTSWQKPPKTVQRQKLQNQALVSEEKQESSWCFSTWKPFPPYSCPKGGVCGCNPASANSTIPHQESQLGKGSWKRQSRGESLPRLAVISEDIIHVSCWSSGQQLNLLGESQRASQGWLRAQGSNSEHLAKAMGETGQLHHADTI